MNRLLQSMNTVICMDYGLDKGGMNAMATLEVKIEVPDCNHPYQNTETAKNLWIAYIGECMARNRYTYYASMAKKAGYEEMAAIFLQTADNEKEHAKIWFKQLNQLCGVRDNLVIAADGEKAEWYEIYPHMAKTAYEEGFPELFNLFKEVAAIEHYHEEKFRRMIDKLDRNEFFHRTGIVIWECRNCGYISFGDAAPELCPVCQHPQGYFQVKCNAKKPEDY